MLVPSVFSPHFVSVIRAGELSSKLPETFDDLKKYLEWVEQILADVRQAATLCPALAIPWPIEINVDDPGQISAKDAGAPYLPSSR